MRNATSRLLAVALVSGAAGLLVLGRPAEVRAQTTLLCPVNTPLANGQCGDGAFSGAALSSQALSELSETTTQETSRNTINKMTERREAEQQRCAAGFRRVDGECQPISPPVREAEAVVPPPPSPNVKKPKKPKVAAAQPEEEQVAAAKAARREKPQPKPPQASVAPLPAMVCKDGPCAPIPIEPAARFGAWVQVNGDYEHRDATAPAFVTNPGSSPIPVQSSVQSRSGTVGIQLGGDFTSRGIWAANDGLIVGVMEGAAYSNLTLNSSALSSNFALVHNLSGQMDATLAGGMGGLYATYFNGGFSTDFLAKADVFALGETFTDLLSYPVGNAANFVTVGPPCTPTNGPPAIGTPFDCSFGKPDPIPVVDVTLMGDFNYKFLLNPNYWIEPTVGFQFTSTTYLQHASDLGLANGDLVMVQGGARIGSTTLLDNHILMTTIVTGLIYDDVLVSGGFIPSEAFNGNNLLAQADQGQVRGRGIFAFNFDFGQGVSTYVLADVRGGKGLFGAGGKAGVRYVW